MNQSRKHCSWWFARSCVIALVMACLPVNSPASSPSTALSGLSLPDATSLQIVSSNAVHNGVSQAIAALHSDQSFTDVAEYYKRLWASDGNAKLPGYIETHLPPWLLISRLQEGYNIVVQLDTEYRGYGSTGFISIRALGAVRPSFQHGQFADLDLLSSNDTVDGVDRSSLRVYASRLPTQRTHEVYKNRLLRQGWAVLSESVHQSSHMTVLSRDNVRLELSFLASGDYASVIVVHRITSD